MIQRIQTIYLLAAMSLMIMFATSTLATFTSSEGIYSLSASGIQSVEGEVVYSMPYLLLCVGLTIALPAVIIFLFKKRMLQIRLCVVQIVLTVGVLVIGGVYYYLSNRFFDMSESALRIVCALPLVSILFDYLALRAIFKDELLVKSLDRIR